MNRENSVIVAAIILLCLALIFVAMLGLSEFMNEFSRELRYVNNEIGHTTGSAKRYWLRRRRRLWLSLLPFIQYDTDEEEP